MLILLFITFSYVNSPIWLLLISVLMTYIKFLCAAPHTLKMLLVLEISAILSLLLIALKMMFVAVSFLMIFLTLSVVEACLGLSLMISVSRVKGGELLKN